MKISPILHLQIRWAIDELDRLSAVRLKDVVGQDQSQAADGLQRWGGRRHARPGDADVAVGACGKRRSASRNARDDDAAAAVLDRAVPDRHVPAASTFHEGDRLRGDVDAAHFRAMDLRALNQAVRGL